METDRHYFVEGLFVIGFAVAAALFFVWLLNSGHRDDVLYRIHFAESVSGLALGDPVKFRGVDVGTVRAMSVDPTDPSLVQVDVSLRKDAPIRTDTKASLKLKGFTGVVVIELNGGSVNSRSLVAATPEGQVPEIPSERSTMATVLDELPKTIDKFSRLEDQSRRVLSDISGLTARLKENPSLLLFPPKEKEKEKAASQKMPGRAPR